MKAVFALIVFLFCLSPASAQYIAIPEKCRIPNSELGHCSWSCLETIARFYQIKPLYGIVATRVKEQWDYIGNDRVKAVSGYEDTVAKRLQKLGVSYRMYYHYRNSKEAWELFNKCLLEKRLFMISIKEGAFSPGSELHSVIVVGMNDNHVYIWNPNNPDKIETYTRAWLEKNWTKHIIVIYNK